MLKVKTVGRVHHLHQVSVITGRCAQRRIHRKYDEIRVSAGLLLVICFVLSFDVFR